MATVVDTALVSARITRAGVHMEVRMQKAEPPWSFGIMKPFGAAVRLSSRQVTCTVKRSRTGGLTGPRWSYLTVFRTLSSLNWFAGWRSWGCVGSFGLLDEAASTSSRPRLVGDKLLECVMSMNEQRT